MSDTQLDTISIKITADTADTAKNIRSVTTALKALDRAVSAFYKNSNKDFDFGKMNNVYHVLSKIASIDFSNVAMGLRDVSRAFDGLANKQAKSLPKVRNAIDMEAPRKTDNTFATFTGENEIKAIDTDRYYSLPSVFKYVTSSAQDALSAINSVGVAMNDVNSAFDNTKSTVYTLGEDYKDIYAGVLPPDYVFTDINGAIPELKDIGYASEEATTSLQGMDNALQDLDETAGKASFDFKKIYSAIGRIALYRAIRAILKSIAQTVKEGIDDIARVSDTANKTMTEITNSTNYLKASFVSALMPAITALQPVITALCDNLARLMNLLGSLSAKALGQADFAVATKSADDYRKSLEKAKSASLGIDELNALSGNNDYKFSFEDKTNTDTSDSNPFAGFVSGIQNIIESMEPAFSKFSDMLSGVAESVSRDFKAYSGLFESMFGVIADIMSALSPLYENVMPAIGSALEFVYDLTADIYTILSEAVKLIGELLAPAIETIVTFIEPIVHIIGQTLSTFFKSLRTGVSLITDMISEPLGALRGINRILTSIGKVVNAVLVAPLKIVASIINGIYKVFGAIYDAILSIFGIGISDKTEAIADDIGSVGDRITEVADFISNSIGTITNSIGSAFDFIANGIKAIPEHMKEIANNITSFFTKTIPEFFSKIGQWFSDRIITPIVTFFTKTIPDGFRNAFEVVVNGVITATEWVINKLIDVVNGISGGLSKVWTWALGDDKAIPKIPSVSFGRVSFAQGGFPEDGMFFANHNELVGQFSNGRTAVANNEQITQGIYMATLQAFQDAGFTNGFNTDVKVYVDGSEIPSKSKKTSKLFSGGNF